ncbi:peroxide stress protein YaaA [Georgenia sp. 10Sc9-8]|uniref:Peroxide stress protein YaaA n=1 Tax=Georgenia halotolerans TaxID=3028317 RepID=A0ABT5TT68_9MICO|nr:peroxide stress protein YaaA [Georgenia halotolerans]
MLILLPPSEGKTPPAGGAPVDLSRLTAPQLAAARERVLGTLMEVSARPDALEVLGVGAGVRADVARNTRLTAEPAARSAEVYTGVLYAAAQLDGLEPAGAAGAARSVRIVSALWGLLSPADLIPAYRLSMSTALPGTGRLSTYWRRHLGAELDERARGDVVVDCRSAAYTAAWRPPADAEHLTVRVVRDDGGRRQVVSHHAKHARGLLTRHLLTAGGTPTTGEEVAEVARTMPTDEVRGVELAPSARPGRPRVLTLVV